MSQPKDGKQAIKSISFYGHVFLNKENKRLFFINNPKTLKGHDKNYLLGNKKSLTLCVYYTLVFWTF